MATFGLLRSLWWHNLSSSSYRSLTGNAVSSLGRSFSSKAFQSDHVGISFGCTKSYVSIVEEGIPKVVGSCPSVVAFKKNGELIAGTAAKHLAESDPSNNTVAGVKWLLGVLKERHDIKRFIEMVSYKVVQPPHDVPWVEYMGSLYTPTQITAPILAELKKIAESYTKKPVTKAIITFPADWGRSQTTKLREAGIMAGFELQVCIHEPIATTISHGLINKEGIIAVIDVGGMSLDACISEISKSDYICKGFKTNKMLGGDNFDNAIMNYVVRELKITRGIDLTNDKLTLQRLSKEVEQAKIKLSSSLKTEIKVSSNNVDENLSITLTRAKFEFLVSDLVLLIESHCESFLREVGVKAKDVNEVLLVGGMANVPIVKRAVAKIFGRRPRRGVKPEEAVALGAAAAAAPGSGVFIGDVWQYCANEESYSGRFDGKVFGATVFSRLPPGSWKVANSLLDSKPLWFDIVVQCS